MLHQRAWREWARRFNLREYPSGELPLVPEVQPVLILDDQSRLAARPQRMIFAWGTAAFAGPTVAERSTFRLVPSHPCIVRGFHFTVTGNYEYGVFSNAAINAVALATAFTTADGVAFEGPLTTPFGPNLPPLELDFGTTATGAFSGGSGGGAQGISNTRYTGFDYLLLPGQTWYWQSLNTNVLMQANLIECELIPWPGFFEQEAQPDSR